MPRLRSERSFTVAFPQALPPKAREHPALVIISNSQYEAGSRRFVRFRPKNWPDTPKSARFWLGCADPFSQEIHIENSWVIINQLDF